MSLLASDLLPSLNNIRSRGKAHSCGVLSDAISWAAHEARIDLPRPYKHNRMWKGPGITRRQQDNGDPERRFRPRVAPWADERLWMTDLSKEEFEKALPAGKKLFSVERIGCDWIFTDHKLAVEAMKYKAHNEHRLTIAMNTDTILDQYVNIAVIYRST